MKPSPPLPPSSLTTPSRLDRDRSLDVVRTIAVVRVVMWHTWSWAWLSWIPAMPAMFFASGALLEHSLERRGWWATVRQRARRLLVPFWVYGLACWALMWSLGWRPSWGEAVGWLLPLTDPVGSDATPGLWIPLWYVRAYLWFVLAAGVLSWALRRFGPWVMAGTAAGTVVLWFWIDSGRSIPLELGDAVTYSTFVLAGMWYWRGGELRRPVAFVASGVVLAVAVGWWWWFGPADGIVNRSYALTMLVGLAGVGVVLGLRDRLAQVSGRFGLAVDRIGQRALTIYLWQGFGLVAAQWLVAPLDLPLVADASLSMVVVTGVIVAAVVVVGPVEDIAARRWRPSVPRTRSSVLTSGRRAVWAVPGLSLLIVAVALPIDRDPSAELPLSGRAVVARAEYVGRDPTWQWAQGTTPEDVIENWLAAYPDLTRRVGLSSIEGAWVTPGDEVVVFVWNQADGLVSAVNDEVEPPLLDPDDPMDWWSITKAVTSTWLLRSVEAGTVALSDTLDLWVPEVPNADVITLEHLARHTSGIPTEVDSWVLSTSPVADLSSYNDSPALGFEPGEGFAYSRVGYHLLGLALERANATTWRAAMEEMADSAQVGFVFDEDVVAEADVTDPDGHGYRGRLWASGGLLSTVADGARFFRWVFTDGLSVESLDAMTTFSADPERWYYGLGLMPLCPCEMEGDRLSTARFGLDAATGTVAIDGATGATLMLRPDKWFDDDGPMEEFYELQWAILEVLSAR